MLSRYSFLFCHVDMHSLSKVVCTLLLKAFLTHTGLLSVLHTHTGWFLTPSLHLRGPLPGMLFLSLSPWLAPSHPSGLSFHIISSEILPATSARVGFSCPSPQWHPIYSALITTCYYLRCSVIFVTGLFSSWNVNSRRAAPLGFLRFPSTAH